MFHWVKIYYQGNYFTYVQKRKCEGLWERVTFPIFWGLLPRAPSFPERWWPHHTGQKTCNVWGFESWFHCCVGYRETHKPWNSTMTVPGGPCGLDGGPRVPWPRWEGRFRKAAAHRRWELRNPGVLHGAYSGDKRWTGKV